MSLIADALKAAQHQRRGSDASRVAAARTVIGGPPSAVRRPATARLLERREAGTPRKLQFALAGFGVAVVGAVAFVVLADPPEGSLALDPVAAVAAPLLPDAALATGNPIDVLPDPDDADRAIAADWWDRVETAPLAEAVEPAGIDGEQAEPLAPISQPVTAEDVTGSARGSRAPASAGASARQPDRAADARFQLTVESRPQSPSTSAAEEGLAALRRGDPRAAIPHLRAALELAGEDADLLNRLGTAHQALAELPEARDAYRRAVAARPGFAAAWSNLGVVLLADGQSREAQLAFAEAVRLDRGNEGARVNLAILYHGQGLVAEARSLLDEVLRGNARHAEAHYALGRVLEQEGDRMGAVRHYQGFLTHGAGRFPQLEPQVRERVRQLTGAGR